MKKHFIKTMLLALLCAVGGVGAAWADEATVPTPVYFNDFSSTDGLTIKGSGEFITDDDERFGQIYHNDPTLKKAIRTNYLLLPSDVLSHSATTKEMTIGFWVNVKNAKDFFFSPIFAAYAAEPTTGGNGWPMFVCEARGLIQLNCAGYCDFGINADPAGTTYNDGTPYVTSAWLDDTAWHYYTVALTSTTAKVYVDGELKNGWTVDGTSDGQVISGLFTNGSDLNYICLGGNQAWGWGDPDPAFGFDDFAVYDAALSADQIKQIMANKLSEDEEVNVVYERGNVTDWSETDLSDWAGSGNAEINNGLKTSAGNAGYERSLSVTTKDNSKLVLTATWNTGSSIGRNEAYNY